MPEFVYALHDFVPEHEDEISFQAGDRIEVVEKDELYGDGWWQGRNLFGKIGLFPQSYTTSDPAIFQQQPQAQSTDSPQPSVSTDLPPTIQLQPVDDEKEKVSEDVKPANGVESEEHNRVMRATLTDVQEAIEQLGRKDRDGAGSFSFASSRDGDHTDHETDTESAHGGDKDEINGNGDAVWNKGTRTLLAEKARMQQQEQQEMAQSSFERDLTARLGLEPASSAPGRSTSPPIALELSDESDADDDDEDDSRALGMLYPRREHAHLPEVNEEDEDSMRLSNGTIARPKTDMPSDPEVSHHKSRPSENGGDQSRSQLASELVVPAPDESESQTATARQSSFPLNKEGASPKPHPGGDDATSNGSSLKLQVSQSAPAPPFSPISPTSPSEPGLKTSASLSRLKAGPEPTKSMIPALPSPPPSQNGASSSMSTDTYQTKQFAKPTGHPSEWSVDEVVEWAKSKNFDQNVCDKFVEHEISGDVLLDLDVNLLKSELEIVAFGKRMRIANAIAELRRPPSVISERTHSQAASHTLSHQHSQSQSFSGPDSANPSLHNPYSSVLSAESPPHTGDIMASPAALAVPRRDSDPGSSQKHGSLGSTTRSVSDLADTSTTSTSIGLGIGLPVISSSPIGSLDKLDSGKLTKNRPAQLTLSPSDNALRGKKGGKVVADQGDDDRAALSDTETGSLLDNRNMRMRLFGRSPGSANSELKENGSSRTSHDRTPVSSTPASPSLKRPSIEESNGSVKSHIRQRKRSVDASKTQERHSIFGNSFPSIGGKSRKPAPRVSGYAHDDIATEKHRSTFPRLYLGNRKASLKSSEEDLSPRKEKDGNTLRKRSTDSPMAIQSADPLKPGQSVLEQIGEPDHNGYMRKKGERYNTWKLRYFVLKGAHLYYMSSHNREETKIKGYINTSGYKVIVDENVNPGKYGFRLVHDTEKAHYFCSDEQLVVREWMKALMKATIARDYTKPVISSCNIPTIPLAVAQTMNPAPRPPSPTQRDATQKALRRENPNQLSSRDARILMGLPSGQNGSEVLESSKPPDGTFTATVIEAQISQDSMSTTTSASTARTTSTNIPPRPSREVRRTSVQPFNEPQNELIRWANDYIPEKLRLSDECGQLHTGLALFRVCEAIKGRPSEPPVPDSAFPQHAGDDRPDGLFKLFDFFLDNDVRVGNISLNDIRFGDREKVLSVIRCMKSWEERRRTLAKSLSRNAAHAGPFMALEAH